MKSKTFHWELRTIIAMFSDAFNDIVINRYNADKAIEDQIHVNFRFAPKTRVLHDLVQLNQNFKLPVVSIVPGGLRRDPNRVFNKIEGSYHTDTKAMSAWMHLLQPVPVILTVNMSIIGRFQLDIDQILTNFIPYCDPYVVVSTKWPDPIPWNDFEIRSHIIWNEDVNFQYPIDITNTAPYRIIADTSFKIETWMFKNSPNPAGPIYYIDHSFTSMKDLDTFESMKDQENSSNTDSWYVSGRPFMYQVYPFEVYTTDSVSTSTDLVEFNLLGSMFDYVDRLFVSGTSGVFDMSWTPTAYTSSVSTVSGMITITGTSGVNPYWHDFFSNTPNLSAFYPPFSGVEIPSGSWSSTDKNTIVFSTSAINTGFFDIIAVNSAGYGKLTADANRPTINPYKVGSVDYNNYQEWQPPYISGVQIIQVR